MKSGCVWYWLSRTSRIGKSPKNRSGIPIYLNHEDIQPQEVRVEKLPTMEGGQRS